MSKLKSAEFRKNRYSERYKALQREVKKEIRSIKSTRIQKAVEDAGGNNSWLSRLESLLDPDGCSTGDDGVLTDHRDQGLTRQEQAEAYARHISQISRDYVPLGVAQLPERVQHALDNAICCGHPHVDEASVFKNLSERKLTGGVEGDLAPRVAKDCMVELSHPVSCLYKESLDTHTWQSKWKQEKQIVIPKCPAPCTKDDMRNLGLSPFLNKGFMEGGYLIRLFYTASNSFLPP